MTEDLKKLHKNKWAIFDLDGTLADITARRKLCELDNGKLDWDKFFDPKNISLDIPNTTIITLAQMLNDTGVKILILSGRSKKTKDVTIEWLKENKVPYNVLKMRPTSHKWNFMSDDKLKQYWLDDLFPGENKKDILVIFDDRDKVVKMWRENKLPCLQVAEGKF